MTKVFCTTLILSAALWAQEATPDRVTVPFSDAARPRMLKVRLLNGSISVTGYDGKEVIVEARAAGSRRTRSREGAARADGLRRIDNAATGLVVEEQDNVVTVGTRAQGENIDLVIQVPVATSLNLRATNGGDISVERISGEIDVDNTNGQVHIKNVSGAVIAHALNGKVTATLDSVMSGKAMSFSSLNGDIDVTLPADVKANVKMKTDHGEIYTDFEVKLDMSSRKPSVEKAEKGARYRVQFDKAMYGTINGGGPEFQFTTFNGRVYIRKKK